MCGLHALPFSISIAHPRGFIAAPSVSSTSSSPFLTRKPLIRSWTIPTSARELESHFFPYGTLQILQSHIQPHFVVYNLGKKLWDHDWRTLLLQTRYKPLMSQYPTSIACIGLCMDLYNEW